MNSLYIYIYIHTMASRLWAYNSFIEYTYILYIYMYVWNIVLESIESGPLQVNLDRRVVSAFIR